LLDHVETPSSIIDKYFLFPKDQPALENPTGIFLSHYSLYPGLPGSFLPPIPFYHKTRRFIIPKNEKKQEMTLRAAIRAFSAPSPGGYRLRDWQD